MFWIKNKKTELYRKIGRASLRNNISAFLFPPKHSSLRIRGFVPLLHRRFHCSKFTDNMHSLSVPSFTPFVIRERSLSTLSYPYASNGSHRQERSRRLWIITDACFHFYSVSYFGLCRRYTTKKLLTFMILHVESCIRVYVPPASIPHFVSLKIW